MISVTLVGAEEVKANFESLSGRLHTSVLVAITSLSKQLEAHVKLDKLEGQVLNHITGRLQSSIHSDVQDSSDTITGRVYSSGCNYAAIHEYGFSGSEVVREHIRTHVFGKEVAPFTVGSFTRTMNMPERSFLRSALKDFEPKIIRDLNAAVAKAIK